eukprot:121335-Pelagomonas_calceolata.AAC.3
MKYGCGRRVCEVSHASQNSRTVTVEGARSSHEVRKAVCGLESLLLVPGSMHEGWHDWQHAAWQPVGRPFAVQEQKAGLSKWVSRSNN